MITLTNKAEETIEIKENEYYWYYANDTFKLIKIIEDIKTKEIVYKDIELQDQNTNLKIIEYKDDKRIPYKEKSNLRYFNPNELCPRTEDLSSLPSISYPAILYNFKLKNDLRLNTSKAGKLNIGLNLTKANLNDLDNLCNVSNFDMSENNTIIINGIPNTGKTILTKRIIENLNGDFKIFQDYINILELFGNCIDETTSNNAEKLGEFNDMSSRYQRVVKFYFNKFKNANRLMKVKFKHYLCEKNRVVEECVFNFHIFHLLIEGLNRIFKSTNLENTEKVIYNEFSRLKETGLLDEFYQKYNNFDTSANVDFNEYYIKKFNLFLNFAKKKAINELTIKNIFKLVIAILLLNHIDFDIDQEGKAIIYEDNKIICLITEILDCDKTTLIKRLISREYRSPRGSFYVTKLSKEDAKHVKDTYIKYIYEHLINFMTKYINLLINEDIRKLLQLEQNEYDYIIKEKKSRRFTQIIECFGFDNNDNPQRNSLENLLINYTND
jgi:myosin heavy subunit